MQKIGVVGLGLIGASLLKSLKKTDEYYLLGVSRSQETVDKALSLGIANEASTDTEILKDADIVFVCTPINKTVETIEKIAAISNALITDTASIKEPIVDYFKDKSINFIGSHPMAGTENKGIDASVDNLFDGAKWVITPYENTPNENIEALQKVIKSVNASCVTANANDHDRAVALISHLPMLLAQNLFDLVQNQNESLKRLALQLSASGFRDTTRLSMSNTDMAKDMLDFNQPNIENSSQEFAKNLEKILEKYKNGQIDETLQRIVHNRANLYDNDGKNTYETEQ